MSRHADMAPVVVLGAGLSGASVALELAARGIPVVLLERDRLPFNRASLRNEGKIHLGFIYAGDTTRATAALQLQGALRFGGLMRRWLGPAAATLAHSTPFHYVVAKDSIQRPGELEQHYRQVQRLHDEALAADPSLDYLGKRPSRLFERVEPASLRPFVDADAFDAIYRTEEVAIDPAQLADHVRDALANTPLIDLRTGHRVDTVRSKGPGFEVAGDDPRGGRWRIAGRQVVNCCWEDRPRIDHGAGLVPPPGWLHRLKYRVVARLPAALRGGPSITMVLGPYGDVVVRPDGTAYFSWYPLGLRGWTHDLAPPSDWDAPCRGDASDDDRARTARQLLDAIDRWYPGAAASEPLQVDAGAIVGYGRTDVDDPLSGLHDRTRIGVRSSSGYHSLDPGKLTTAPLFGVLAADRVCERA